MLCPRRFHQRFHGAWYLEYVKQGRCYEVHWDADRLKLLSQHGLTIPIGTPGSITLFSGTRRTHERFARHICNERRQLHMVPGQRPKYKFIRTGANHLLDGLAEAYCAQCRLGYEPPEISIDAAADPVANDPATAPQRIRHRPEPVAPSPRPAQKSSAPPEAFEKAKKQKDWFGRMR
jgi:hypothetical protein